MGNLFQHWQQVRPRLTDARENPGRRSPDSPPFPKKFSSSLSKIEVQVANTKCLEIQLH